MKRLPPLVLGCLFAAMSLCLLAACEQQQQPISPPEAKAPADSGLVPGKASTGNPPLIPHEVDPSDGGQECLACHQNGEEGAPIMPDWHATLTDCRQCHVVQDEQVGDFQPQY